MWLVQTRVAMDTMFETKCTYPGTVKTPRLLSIVDIDAGDRLID